MDYTLPQGAPADDSDGDDAKAGKLPKVVAMRDKIV